MTALADLDSCLAPDRLVGGSLTGLSETAAAMRRVGDQLADTARGIGYVDLDGSSWSGRAAGVYAAAREVDIASFKAAARVFGDAHAAVADYLAVLTSARATAADAAADYAAGRKQRDDDLAACTPPPPPTDPWVRYDPYGLQAAADRLDAARAEVARAAKVAAPFLRALARLAPAHQPVEAPDEGASLRDVASAPWHLVRGAGEAWLSSMRAWGAGMAPYSSGYTPSAEQHYTRSVDAGTNEAVPALALLGSLAMMGGGVRGGLDGSAEVPAVPRPRTFSNLAPEDPIVPGRTIPLSKLTDVNGRFQYIVRESGQLLVGRGGHIDLAQGSDVLAAGEVKVVQGEVRALNNASGHFRPDASVESIAKTAIEQQTDLVIRPDAWKAEEH